MFLSPRHRVRFVHIAKTGGTSIRRALKRLHWSDPYSIPIPLVNGLTRTLKYKTGAKFPRHAKGIAAYECIGEPFWSELFKFTFVRNPWDLQVSSYHHIRREVPHVMESIEGFPQFIRWKLDPERPYQYHVDTSIELQSDYLVDLRGKVIVDFLGRYERLQEDFDEVCGRIGIPRRELPEKRKAKDRGAYREYYDDETAEMVARHFRRDIEEFGYRFDSAVPDPVSSARER